MGLRTLCCVISVHTLCALSFARPDLRLPPIRVDSSTSPQGWRYWLERPDAPRQALFSRVYHFNVQLFCLPLSNINVTHPSSRFSSNVPKWQYRYLCRSVKRTVPGRLVGKGLEHKYFGITQLNLLDISLMKFLNME